MDDDSARTPTGSGGTAPLLHVISQDGKLGFRRPPQGYRIHQPASVRPQRTPRTPRAPLKPVVIADSSPSSENFPVMDLSKIAEAAAEEVRATPQPAAPVRPIDPSKNTLPSRTSPLAQGPGTVRIVILSATISALMSSLIFIAAYIFLLHGR